jgi:hypothetical protein
LTQIKLRRVGGNGAEVNFDWRNADCENHSDRTCLAAGQGEVALVILLTDIRQPSMVSANSTTEKRGLSPVSGPRAPKQFHKETITMNRKLAAITVAAIATFASTPPATAAEVTGGVAGAFSKGRTHFVATVGNGYAFDESYFVVGLGVSYYLIDGLNIGLSLESWSGSDPGMYKVTPSVQYVFHQMSRVKPYVGGFFRRAYVDGQPDINSVGARGGVYLSAGRNAYIGIGAVYESYIDCNNSVYRSCSDTYPEVSFTIAF